MDEGFAFGLAAGLGFDSFGFGFDFGLSGDAFDFAGAFSGVFFF